MDIQVGQHVYRNTDGTIEIEGALQMEISLRSGGASPQLTFAIFDGAGKMPAKLQDNNFSINQGSAYSLTKSQTSLMITHPESGTEVLNLTVESEKKVVISKGSFYTLKGHIINITPEEWTLEKTTVKKGETDMKGKAARLG
tara:strand:+ start:286 stop:711 length:426 start_codon:yes stop_codon:yes gene_type:complete